MNLRIFTGYLRRDAWAAVSPAPSFARKLIFEAFIQGREGEFCEKCVIENPDLIAKCEAFLDAGRTIMVQGEIVGRPFVKNDVQTGWIREVLVTGLEIPNRKKSETESKT
jgi:hypothetical protein